MASRRRPSPPAAEALLPLAFLLLACLSSAAAAAKQTGQLTVFWGRNAGEGTLREACDTGLYTTVVISFYSVFGHGRYWGDLSGHPLAGVGADIKHCQSRNVLVLLSIGGPGTGYSLPSSQSAADVADNLWNAHLGGRRRGVFRPFGDAAVDGIDFYIDVGGPGHYDELARRLDGYNRFYRGRKGVRLTATPRCGFPDSRLDGALRTGLFERIHVRFYGNDTRCAYGAGAGTWGVAEAWKKWAARYPRSEVYLGLAPAESGVPEGAQGTVAVYLKYLYYDLLPKVQEAPNYGGVMVWDRFSDKKTRWSTVVKGWA
ncbi:xylanase inhibitor protein 1-like [Panicum virgatum]|uniref:GH18 domain-containing protein n=1 Tax=Panicum virgatum TaxID=38727 RepID=A0A8T0P5V2_PANVG|nr:xylanase inhibitor protein 1-like [Panicum virgatum]KAG2557010.1 hypothetical protein PVAP13_8NG183700 [Panicum virgatum]